MSKARVYLDNAATSFPKPDAVHEAMARYSTDPAFGAGSPGRGAYAEARRAGQAVIRCRERILRLIGGQGGPERIVFALNCSDALNLGIKGLLAPLSREAKAKGGAMPHVVTSAMDHNSVLRPLRALEERGEISVTRVACDPFTGALDARSVAAAITPSTRLVALNHASNVTGVIQPIEAIGAACAERGVPLLVDAAQSLGHMPIDARAMNIAMLAFPGHKGLLGPTGTGGLYLAPGMEALVEPIREGGTGSHSELDRQPDELPDKYEPGSLNTLGIVGLSEGARWILDRGVEALREHELGLCRAFLDELEGSAVRVVGPAEPERRVAVFSVSIVGVSPHELAMILESHFGLLTRAGLHCAPLAHENAGTLEGGGLTRLSFGAFNSEGDARYAARSLIEVARSSNVPVGDRRSAASTC